MNRADSTRLPRAWHGAWNRRAPGSADCRLHRESALRFCTWDFSGSRRPDFPASVAGSLLSRAVDERRGCEPLWPGNRMSSQFVPGCPLHVCSGPPGVVHAWPSSTGRAACVTRASATATPDNKRKDNPNLNPGATLARLRSALNAPPAVSVRVLSSADAVPACSGKTSIAADVAAGLVIVVPVVATTIGIRIPATEAPSNRLNTIKPTPASPMSSSPAVICLWRASLKPSAIAKKPPPR